MSAFSIEDVRKIAKLASLELTPEEEQEFAQQFGTILDYFERLNAVELPENAEAAESVFHWPRGWLKLVAPLNTFSNILTLSVLQLDSGWLKAVAL